MRRELQSTVMGGGTGTAATRYDITELPGEYEWMAGVGRKEAVVWMERGHLRRKEEEKGKGLFEKGVGVGG